MNRHATRRIFLAIVALAMIASLFLPAVKLYVHSQLGGETAALFQEHTSAWQMAFAPHSGLPADAIRALGLVTYSAVYQVIAAVLLVLSAGAIALGRRKQTIAGLILAALSVPFSGAFVLQLTNLSSSLLFRLLITPQIAIYLPLAGAVVLMLTAVVSLHGSKAEREAEGYKKAPSLLSEKQWRLLCAVLALLSALVMLLPVYSISVPETVTGSPADAAALNRNVSMLEAGLGRDSMLSALDEATRLYTTLKDQGGISPEQVQAVLLMLQQSNPDLDLGDLDLEELTEAIAFEGISEEDLQRLEDEIVERTGMTVEELRASIQQQRDEIAAMDGESPLTEEQFEQLKQAYAANKEQVDQVTATISEQIQDLRAQLDEAEGQMNAAREQMAQMEPMMEQGKSAIEQARAALDMAGSQMAMGEQGLAEGRRQLEEQQKELKEKEEQLRREKEQLDREAQTLADQSAEVSDRKETERRETSVRLMLLEREEIQSRVEGGMELLDACDDYAAQMLSETEKNFSDRLVISLLMILGGIAGFVGLPAAFEKTNSRFWLIAPVLLCLGCGAAAEVLCRLQGRGDSYSALGAAIFALIQLVLVIPKKKKA